MPSQGKHRHHTASERPCARLVSVPPPAVPPVMWLVCPVCVYSPAAGLPAAVPWLPRNGPCGNQVVRQAAGSGCVSRAAVDSLYQSWCSVLVMWATVAVRSPCVVPMGACCGCAVLPTRPVLVTCRPGCVSLCLVYHCVCLLPSWAGCLFLISCGLCVCSAPLRLRSCLPHRHPLLATLLPW